MPTLHPAMPLTMDYGDIESFRKSRISEYSPSNCCLIHYYAGTNPTTDEEERVFMLQGDDGVCNLQIENCSYTGNMEEMEDILWEWWHND